MGLLRNCGSGICTPAQRVARERLAALKERVPSPSGPELVSQVDDAGAIDMGVLLSVIMPLLPLIVVIPHMLVAVVSIVLGWGTLHSFGVAELPTEAPPEVIVEYQPQVVDKQEADYGPWFSRGEVFERVTQPGFLNLALLSDDGSVQYSQRFAGKLDGAVPRAYHERVRSRNRGSTVTLGTTTRYLSLLLALPMFGDGCHRETQWESGAPSLSNRARWKEYFQPLPEERRIHHIRLPYPGRSHARSG